MLGQTVDFLAALAGDGAALEFGIGTGRVALPLAQRGVRVCGIDLSEAMVAKLRAKPGAERVDTTIGDFATTRVDGTFSLVYLVFNTICNLTTQDDQVACFQNAADHLEPGGCFVIEVVTPDLQRVSPGERFYPFEVSPDHVGLDEYDVANQGLVSHHLWPEGDGVAQGLGSVPLRLAGGARPDGAPRRDAAPRALAGLGPLTLHEREPQARLRLGAGAVAGVREGHPTLGLPT